MDKISSQVRDFFQMKRNFIARKHNTEHQRQSAWWADRVRDFSALSLGKVSEAEITRVKIVRGQGCVLSTHSGLSGHAWLRRRACCVCLTRGVSFQNTSYHNGVPFHLSQETNIKQTLNKNKLLKNPEKPPKKTKIKQKKRSTSYRRYSEGIRKRGMPPPFLFSGNSLPMIYMF